MAHTEKTLALGADWDLTIGADGGLGILSGDAATLQNVSNECHCFTGDLFFFADHGIAWFGLQLGQKVQKSMLAARLREAALYVPAVQAVDSVEIESLDNSTRTLRGTITIVTTGGTNGAATV